MARKSVAKDRSRPFRFGRLQLGNWKNFVAVDVRLDKRAFIVGPNASGKSNFLDVFQFLHEIVSVGGGFRAAVENREGVSSLRALAARQYSDISIHIEGQTGVGETADLWTYELAFNQDNRKRPYLKLERIARNGQRLLERPIGSEENDIEQLSQTYLEQASRNTKFRELAQAFESIKYLHIVPQLVREPDRSVGKRNDPYGGDFLEQVAGVPEKTQKARLRRIREALAFAVPQLTEVELVRDDRGTPHLRGRYEHWRPQGAWQNENQFSDGTLRLLGLLWAVIDGTGPLLLEEPELSLHPEVVRFLPQMFARIQRRSQRQILLSTHSTDLLLDDGIGLNEVVLLEPATEGTEIRLADEIAEVEELLRGGLNLADAIRPLTKPSNVEQLSLFGDS